jgi:histidine triad (HIT) family protein
MSADCLFCKIAAKKIPAKMVYEDSQIFAFEDIGPKAPIHLLICPRKHIASLADATDDDQSALGKMQIVAAKLARERNLAGGYRTVINTGPDAGQSVSHVHLHLLGGRSLSWPPG